MDPIEEQLYAIAGQEVASRNMSPGLMAKALADADGDERRAAAAYIKLRVEQLRGEHAARAAADAASEQQRRRLKETDSKNSKKKEEARETRCTKCGYVGKMKPRFWDYITDYDTWKGNCECPQCRHQFPWYHFKG